MLKRIGKILYLLVYLLNHSYLLKYRCKINKTDKYLHYLNKIYTLKCISKNIVYLLNCTYLLNYKCKINKKDQYLH